MNDPLFSYSLLWQFAFEIFQKIGCPEDQARQATDALLSADLRGIDSHGVARLSGYVRLWEAKRINAKPDIRIVHESPSTAVVDGDSGLGLVIAPKAMEIAIEKARQCGTGWVAVKNSNHFGIAGYHAMKALQHDMIGMAMTNASPLVAPTYSVERLLGPTGNPRLSLTLRLPRQLTESWRFCSARIRKRPWVGSRTKMGNLPPIPMN